MTKCLLQFHNLFDRHPGVTLGPSASYSEAASINLERHHISPTDFCIDRGGSQLEAIVEWETPNEKDATFMGK